MIGAPMRVKEELMHYGPEHLNLIETAFGRGERERAESLTLIVREDEKDRVDFEPNSDLFGGVTYQIYHSPLNYLGPIVPFHEYCHLLHILQWPRMSYFAPVERCEACAVLGELWLARKLNTDNYIRRCLEYRAVWVHPPRVVALAREAMLRCSPEEDHMDSMSRIMGVVRVRGYEDA
jgi:hypothetical protein